LQSAGFLVERPEMCWSQARIYDQTLADCMTAIDDALARLKARGATSLIVAGHSLGGFGAVYYGATHDGLTGIVAIAPAPGPRAASRRELAAGLARARTLIAQGQGDAPRSFTDANTHETTFLIQVRATPNVFVSFYDTASGGNLAENAARLRAPVLWISGTRDPSQTDHKTSYSRVPPNPLNRLIEIDAAHMETPDKAASQIVDWIKALPSN
jgi:pimeloyl-ACP methyl ester carboxylesterase